MVSLELHDGGILAREEVPSSDVVRERFGYLDGLRTLAILAVLAAEVVKHGNLTAHTRPDIAAALRACSHGLDLFFVISGFALAYPILTLVHQEGRTYLDVARYALKRILRIVPTYYVAIALTVAVPLVAARMSLGALEGPVPAQPEIVRQALFAGNTLSNDGFWSLALTMRWYVLFPFLTLLWVRLPIGFLVAAAGLWALNFYTSAHTLGVGVLPAFMLGIVAADIRAQRHKIERFALPLALLAGAAGVYFEPALAALPGTPGQPAIYAINPAWQLALFFLLVGIGFFGVIERFFEIRLFGMAAAASYAISLVADPVSGFVTRRLALQGIGREGAAANAGAIAIIMGVMFWLLIDRWFSDGNLRQRLVDVFAPPLRAVLNVARAANINYAARGRLRPIPAAEAPAESEPQSSVFYAPPPRGSGDLAVVMQRTGSPEQLAAEILETKKRLAEQSAALFADPEPEPPVVVREPERPPGFYQHGQRAAPLDAPVSVDADPFLAAQSSEHFGAPPPPAAQPPQTALSGYSLSQPASTPAPELEGWLIPKSFDDDFSRAAAAPPELAAPELPGWMRGVEPPSSLHPQPPPPEAPEIPPPAMRPADPPPPVTIQTTISAHQSPPAEQASPAQPAPAQPPAWEPPPPSAWEPPPPAWEPPPAPVWEPQAPAAWEAPPASPPGSPRPAAPETTFQSPNYQWPVPASPAAQAPPAQAPPAQAPAAQAPAAQAPTPPPSSTPQSTAFRLSDSRPAIPPQPSTPQVSSWQSSAPQEPAAQQPAAQQPAAQQPAAQQPAAQQPAAQQPAAQQPAAQQPAPQQAAAGQPLPIARTPIALPPYVAASTQAGAAAPVQPPQSAPPPSQPIAMPPPVAQSAPPPGPAIAMPPARDDRTLPIPTYAQSTRPQPDPPAEPPAKPLLQQSYVEPRYESPSYTPPTYSAPVSHLGAPATDTPASPAAAQQPPPPPAQDPRPSVWPAQQPPTQSAPRPAQYQIKPVQPAAPPTIQSAPPPIQSAPPPIQPAPPPIQPAPPPIQPARPPAPPLVQGPPPAQPPIQAAPAAGYQTAPPPQAASPGSPLPLQATPLPTPAAPPATTQPAAASAQRIPPALAPAPSSRESQEGAGGQAVRGGVGAEQQESSSPRPSTLPVPTGQRVTISLRPARPPIKVRIGPSQPATPAALPAPSSNGKHALDDVIDG